MGEKCTSLTRYNTGERDTGDSLEHKTLAVISCEPQEEGLVGRDELCDVPEVVRLSLWVIPDWQSFDNYAGDCEEIQLVRPSRRGKSSGVQKDVSGNT